MDQLPKLITFMQKKKNFHLVDCKPLPFSPTVQYTVQSEGKWFLVYVMLLCCRYSFFRTNASLRFFVFVIDKPKNFTLLTGIELATNRFISRTEHITNSPFLTTRSECYFTGTEYFSYVAPQSKVNLQDQALVGVARPTIHILQGSKFNVN